MNRTFRAFALPSRGLLIAVIAGWLSVLLNMVIAFVLEEQLRDAGRPDLVGSNAVVIVLFVTAMVSSTIAGTSLILHWPRHPVGWLFLALGLSISLSAAADAYSAYGNVARPGAVPAAPLVAVVGDQVFIPWLAILGLIMLLTPSGRIDGRPWRFAAWALVTSGAIAFGAGLVRPYRGPFGDRIENPIEITGLGNILGYVGTASIVVLHAGVLMAALSMVVRYGAANHLRRPQLRLLGWVSVPFALLVIAAWIAAASGNEVLLAIAAGGFLSVIPLATAIAIERYHLYEVDRLVSRGLLWLLLSMVLVSCYTIVVIFVGESLGTLGGDSQIPAVVATLATVSILGPARHFLQDGLDRYFNRRRFDAVTTIRRYLDTPSPVVTIEDGLREALADASVTVAYWIDERSRWVSPGGTPVEPRLDAIVLRRHDRPICAIAVDLNRTDRATAEAVAGEALAELENAQLRAAISLQLVEVQASRARIVSAQQAERRRIERNLHDGAQQRLLAVALQLRAAEVSRDDARQGEAIAYAVEQVQVAVRELRDLANGLLPSALSDGGLSAALEDLASRMPVPVRVCATRERLPSPVEETAWFIACEAVTNAVKHARPRHIAITATRVDDALHLAIEDDGIGGADPSGSGLRGIADRAEAIGGRVTVSACQQGGTIMTAELPCVS